MDFFVRKLLIVTALVCGMSSIASFGSSKSLENYRFNYVEKSFSGDMDLTSIQSVSRDVFESLLNDGIPASFRYPFSKVCRNSLEIAEKHQIDPFWLLAIMWTESGYRPGVVSPKGAEGLMQIMPGTHKEITNKLMKGGSRRMNRTAKNIEMGAIYLKHLLRIFDGNYVFATAAYNMGPFNVSRRLHKGRNIGSSNRYLRRVAFAYNSLTSHYRELIRTRSSEIAMDTRDMLQFNSIF